MFLMCFKLIESYFYKFGMLNRLCELIIKRYEFLHFMFRTLLLVIGFSPSYNFRMSTWTKSSLKNKYQALQEGIMSRNPSLFRPLIKPAKSG